MFASQRTGCWAPRAEEVTRESALVPAAWRPLLRETTRSWRCWRRASFRLAPRCALASATRRHSAAARRHRRHGRRARPSWHSQTASASRCKWRFGSGPAHRLRRRRRRRCHHRRTHRPCRCRHLRRRRCRRPHPRRHLRQPQRDDQHLHHHQIPSRNCRHHHRPPPPVGMDATARSRVARAPPAHRQRQPLRRHRRRRSSGRARRCSRPRARSSRRRCSSGGFSAARRCAGGSAGHSSGPPQQSGRPHAHVPASARGCRRSRTRPQRSRVSPRVARVLACDSHLYFTFTFGHQP